MGHSWASMAMGTVVFEAPLCYYRKHTSNLHAVDAGNAEKMRRKSEMDNLMFETIEPLLLRMGVRRDSLYASLYDVWSQHGRRNLRSLGGADWKRCVLSCAPFMPSTEIRTWATNSLSI